MLHPPAHRQHAPVDGQGGQGLGLHVPPAVQLMFGGVGHAALVVMVQMLLASQQAPGIGGMHGPPGAHTMPGVGTPPAQAQNDGSML